MATIEEVGFLSSDVVGWIQRNRREAKEWFSLAENVNRLAQKCMLSLEPLKQDRRRVVACAIYSRVVAHFQAAILLAERGMVSEARSVTRSALEACFVLGALRNDEGFIDEYIDDDEWRRARAGEDWQALGSDTWGMNEKYRDEIRRLTAEANARIKEKSIKKLSTYATAERAGMLGHYRTIYGFLSRTVHCRARDLETSIVMDAEQWPSELKWGPDVDKALLDDVLRIACEVQMISVRSVADLFGKEEFNAPLGDILEKYKKLVAEYE